MKIQASQNKIPSSVRGIPKFDWKYELAPL